MKRISIQVLLPFLFLATAAVPTLAGDTPFASASEPHATLLLNGSPKARGLYPVRVRAIDGRLTARENMPVLQMKPGQYKLQLRPVSIHHMENLPGMVAGHSPRQIQDTLTLTLKPGKTYYIAARIQKNGNWHPVVWKVTGRQRE
ncbi:MAG TPA: hypothetical protein VFM97_11340 [Gammaproteobacteria bacterium]|nr:hypothetical protein [Gammaproteobacteria bacterium]